jgi:hypothetical protein
MGSKGGGGGKINVPQVNVPAGVAQNASNAQGLSQYATSLFDPIAGLTNWASSIATGGQGPLIQPFANTATIAGPQVQFDSGGKGGSNLWSSSFDPQTGLITYANTRDPAQTFQTALNANINPNQYGSFGDLPLATIQQWTQDWTAAQEAKTTGGGVGNAQGGTPNYGPFLNEAWDIIKNQEPGVVNQIPALEAATAAFTQNEQTQGNTLFSQGQTLYDMATTGTGLTPSQQAFVDQATRSEQTSIASMLGAEGLAESTAAPVLEGEAAQQGAATAGQLQQGNIALAQQQLNLAQGAQKLALGGQELSLGEQAAMEQELSSIAAQAAGLEDQMFNEALKGYGVLGNMINVALNGLGVSSQSLQQYTQASIANQQAVVSAQAAEQQAAASSQSSAGGGLGSLLGGGGSGGGLLGGLGSLFGGIGGLFGGGSALAAGSGLAAGSLGTEIGATVAGLAIGAF